jgi:CheY-like chemotaxis protein
MNLCTNAGQAMADRGGILEIGLEEIFIGEKEQWRFPSLTNGRYLKLDVRDTGHGIPQEDLGKIFDPYFTTKGKGEGTGLGLAVVHGIAKEHGGDVRVYSEIGRGSVFSVYLPLMEKPADIVQPPVEPSFTGGNERILFIDDEEPLADLGKDFLEGLGYRVVAETDPVKAIDAFREDQDAFDLVITDKTMPHMTGFDVARELRKFRADIPVILCSGFQEKEDLEKQSALGIRFFIMKPVRMHELADAVRNALKKE